MTIFLRPWAPFFSPVICFLVMFSADALHKTVDVRDRRGDSSRPPRVQDLLIFPNCFFVLCLLDIFSIDPFARHTTVSAQLHCRSLTTRVHSDVWSQIPSVIHFLCGELRFIQYVINELLLILRRVLLLSRKHPVFPTRPTCGHLIPYISTIVPLPLMHLVRFSESSFIILACGIATMSYLSAYTLSSRNQSPHSSFHRIPTPRSHWEQWRWNSDKQRMFAVVNGTRQWTVRELDFSRVRVARAHTLPVF